MIDQDDAKAIEAISNQQVRILEFLRSEYIAAEVRSDVHAGAVIIQSLQKITDWSDEQINLILPVVMERSEHAEPAASGS